MVFQYAYAVTSALLTVGLTYPLLATTDRTEFYGRFALLDGLIDRFIATVPPIDRTGNPDVALTSLVTHTLARAATIQLRSSFRDYDRVNDGKDLVAAQTAAVILESFNIVSRHVDPILAVRVPPTPFPHHLV